MSLLKTIRNQLGLSATAGNNFTLTAEADNGTMKLARGNAGATTQDLITVSATNVITGATGSVLVGNGPAFIAQASTSTNVGNNTPTKIVYATELSDTNNNYDAGNSRFTPTVAGYYFITGSSYVSSPIATGSTVTLSVYKNGSSYAVTTHTNGIAAYDQPLVTTLVYMNGTTDYVEIYTTQNTGATINTVADTSSKFSGFLARAA